MIEVTRRCQLQCKHCMRGDSQDIDISYDAIDNLLNNTEMIGKLSFTGGEPTLNLDIISYFLQEASNRKIPIAGLDIITNGVDKSMRLVKLIEGYYKHIAYCQSYMHPYRPAYQYIHIGVSTDKFHTEDAKYAYIFYRELLDGKFASVSMENKANMPKRIGRAKNMDESYSIVGDDAIDDLMRYPCKVPIIEKDNMPSDLKCVRNFRPKDDQAIIPCTLYLTAKGDLICPVGDIEYKIADECCKICNLNHKAEIYEKIKEYNQCLRNTSCQISKSLDCLRKSSVMRYAEKQAKINGTSKEAEVFNFIYGTLLFQLI